MTIQKPYPFKTQNKIYETNHSISHPAKQPVVEMHSPMMDEQFRQYLQYRSLEYRNQPEANPEALGDLEGMMGDLNDYGTEFFPSSETEKAPAEEKSPAETKKERLALRKELDQVKTEIRKAGLDPETEKGLMD